VSETAWDAGRLRGSGEPSVVFGFQHEDSAIEASFFAEGGGGRALCIASGGETALSLLAAGASEVVAVDVNPAQLRLVELKTAALKDGRSDWLIEELCFCGVVERRTRLLGPSLRWFARRPDGLRWRIGWALLRVAVSLGYASRFRSRLPRGWSARLASRISERIASGCDDPLWLAELGLGFGPDGLPVYAPGSVAEIVSRLDRLRLVRSDLAAYLRDRPSEAWFMIALSNIADTMGNDDRTELLSLVSSHLTPGGIVVLRSIVHPAGVMPDLPEWEWLRIPDESGVICPVIGIGRRR
jgi:Protein of unknown function (DUF3419)